MHKQLADSGWMSVWCSVQRMEGAISVGLKRVLVASLLSSFALTGLFFSMQALGLGWQTVQPFEGIAFASMSGGRSRLNSPGGGCGSLDGGTVSGSGSGGSPSADLEVTKFVDNPNPREGDTIVYTILLANLGPDDATLVHVRDVLPAGVTYTGDIPGRGSYNSYNGLWSLNNLVYCDSATLTISATVDSGTAGKTITNTASYVSAEPPDFKPGNNVGEAVIKVQLPVGADLAITKTVNITNPNAGDTITYTVTVNNNGPDDATGVEISDTLPISLTFERYTATQGVYTGGIWTVGNLSNTASATLTIEVKVNEDTSGQAITNTASIFAVDQIDTITNNNESRVVINVTPVVSRLIYLPIIYKAPPPPCYTETFTFDNPDSKIGWPPPPTSRSVLVEYLKGEYHMLTRNKTKVHSVTSPLGPYTDYSVQVDVRWAVTTSYTDDDYGIVFDLTRVSDNNYWYYQFNVNNDSNTYRLRKRENGHWINLIPPTPVASSCVFTRTSVNKLKIQRNSSSIDLFINECKLPSYSDSSKLTLPRPGFMGVNIFPSDFVNGEAYFDNFTICTYELNQASINGLEAKPTLSATDK